ncbi:hypothetical protein BVRB_1g014470 isoform A [Beta vulgaris subsp. vulgaris]|nr:hypothetical protein BVRB_1g014470 isoform A [Beta vulgaris subsp. vulgaris]
MRDGVNAADSVSQCDQDVEYLRGLLDELSECDLRLGEGQFGDRSRSRSRIRATTTTRSIGDGERFETQPGPFPYMENISDVIIPFRVGWNDVLGDGNCGFRCVADAFNSGQDRLPHARQHLYNEISMREVYEDVYGGRDFVDAVRNRIMQTQGPVSRNHLLEFVVDLYVVATLYNCIVMYYTVG